MSHFSKCRLPGPLALALIIVLPMLLACTTSSGLREGRELFAAGRVDEGLAKLEQSLRENPDDKELRTYFFRQRELAVGSLLGRAEVERSAGRYDNAEGLFRRVQTIEPDNARARNGMAEIEAGRRHSTLLTTAESLLKRNDLSGAERAARTILTENPVHPGARTLVQSMRQASAGTEAAAADIKGPFTHPITLELRDAPLRSAFEIIARTAGINFVFDREVKADAKLTLLVRNVSIDDALKLILVTQQLERKMLNENSVLIYPNTPAKAREHQELVIKTIFLANADVKQAQALLKAVSKSREVFIDEKLNLVIVKDTPDAVRLAERLLESIDLAEPEVMLEIEVLEISRSKLSELGIRFPDSVGFGVLDPTTGGLSGSLIDLSNRSGVTAYVANPALLLNLQNQDADSSLLANPRIRVRNREKARIHIGEKLPVFTTTSTANVGVSTSVSYLDVGLKLDVEPNVYLDDDVGIKIGLEVSAVVKEVAGPSGTLAYQVGTRSTSSVLRLRNGETQILAGLINDEERSSAQRLPGLGDIPVIGRLFSNQRDNNAKTEIILLITPRIVRNIQRPPANSPVLPSGTDNATGLSSLRITPTPAGTMSVAPSRPGGATDLPAATGGETSPTDIAAPAGAPAARQ